MSTLKEYTENIRNTMATIPSNYNIILDNIKKAESGSVHRNTSEADITNGYGIYRAVYPNAEVFKYLDLIGNTLGLGKSSTWTKANLDKVNATIDPVVDRYLSYLFYADYFKNAHIDLFHPDNVIMMTNLYTNSMKGAWMSVQEGIIDMVKFGYLNVDMKDVSIVDGDFGNKTRDNLILLRDMSKEVNLIFKLSVISGMKTYYIKLASTNPTKFLQYLNGWNNRMETLQHD